MKQKYDESYYNSNNYINYSERRDRYFKLSEEIVDLLKKLSMINKHTKIIDFGAAMGFCVEGICRCGYNASAYEVSQYCIDIMENKGINVLKEIEKCDVLISLDVFEHMEDNEVEHVIERASPKVLICRVPVKRTIDDDKFFLSISNVDESHINCKTKEEWEHVVGKYFKTVLRLNLFSIYDSEGVYAFVAIK